MFPAQATDPILLDSNDLATLGLTCIYVSFVRAVDMPSFASRTFKSGNSEAVRLPKGVAYGAEIEVTIVRSGDVLTIYPSRPPIAALAQRLAALPSPVRPETRDQDAIPEPPGL